MIVNSVLDQMGVLHFYLREMEYPPEITDLELWVGEWEKDGPEFHTIQVRGRVLGKFRQGWEFNIESDPFPQQGQIILVIEIDREPWFYVLREWVTEDEELYWSLELLRHICGDLEEKILHDLEYE